MKSYELHTAQNRQALFAGLKEKVWLETDLLRVWVLADPRICWEALRSPALGVPDVGAIISQFEVKLGRSFDHVRTANDYVLVLRRGAAHAELRKALAKFLADSLKRLESRLPELVDTAVAPLRTAGAVDLYTQVTQPLITAVISEMIGQKVTPDIQNLMLGDILTANKSPMKLHQLNADYGTALEFLSHSTQDPVETACKLNCLTFGFDSLNMALMENMIAAFRDRAAGQPAVLPEYPVETGVSVTFRRALRDCRIGSHQFLAGDLLRLQLQPLGYSSQKELKEAIFGAGPHSCVGRQLSLKLWSHLVKAFNALDLRAEIGSSELIPSHFIARYSSVKIEVLP